MEKRSTADKIGTFFGILAGLAGVIIGVNSSFQVQEIATPRPGFSSHCQTSLPFCILATERAATTFSEAIKLAEKLHPEAGRVVFKHENPESCLEELIEKKPYFAMIFICPDELDVNVAWKWLLTTTRLDSDPFVDIRSGFITGQTPEAATSFMQRIIDLHEGRLQLPGKLIDNLGGNTEMGKGDFNVMPGSFMIPVFTRRVGLETISHGTQGFSKERLSSMKGAGILHFGGHGYPDRIVDTLNGVYVRKLEISPSIVFNGACYTGVTGRWFDVTSGILKEQTVSPEVCFALGILENQVAGYLAALHPDHGIPVYQEMECLAWSGAALGDIIKYTHDGVVIANGGKMPDISPVSHGMQADQIPAQIMLKGTASRILFGDPSLTPIASFTPPPFKFSISESGESSLTVSATLENLELKSTYTNTYAAGNSADIPFNDRALLCFELPAGWTEIKSVDILSITASDKPIAGTLTGFAVEQDQGKNLAHIQVDLPANGYMTGPFRQKDAALVLKIQR